MPILPGQVIQQLFIVQINLYISSGLIEAQKNPGTGAI
jgi:hypothetical protein